MESCVFCSHRRKYRGSRKGDMRVFVLEDEGGEFLGFDDANTYSGNT